ncbi:Ferrous iron transport periplasmic protein EfeO, peptidase-M75 domain [Pseudomonas chlororaphis subsp. aureofaciens]|uniref:Ferrous iron transport periplasmic protein EfeO, peptidase-M75 domain n=1 Tax=Pseudomonas chlororaphis subsp. aureofaciens TaxID=587851 RepID=A0AAD0ZQ40_9PSED|nr:iron uptake system protein EfeO [Pseudomonas chlororaphis]AZE30181.1 Ferrous iron transport periplasmic protein EfeO, peptidase-M75 domain [Pseudomonas chlororaphis subsp. aureofaciens]AZE36475.1 Ferrous iron transport periplasmic protein EfeO, peptidase-M75 domain [Pseudomonas chlororaphis subsp. aureofaciens]AZE42823.1 Ferrous iron transport periplasmic protein EfeO, peptidase-M75 domain [Pseudomonas chlororaphis subsp. aureofaciens]QHC89969.1 multidrug DMT transporter permease [Pseudomona
MTQQASPQPPAPSALRWALAGSVMVMIAAGGLFYYASQLAASKRQAHKDEITVTIHPHSCEPNALSVPAGLASFRIVNRSDRAVEWEILDGVLVVEERENIAPGLSQVINARLQPGDYAITCGLLSNPRGTLHVTPTTESDAQAKARPSMVAFIGPLSEFRVYLSSQGTTLIKAVSALEQAIQAGDLAQAQALYLPARAAYQRLAPAAQRLGELDNSINARADYFEKREQDPGFVGFHRLEYALFQQRDLSGLAPIAQRLLSDVTTLKQQLLAQSLPPEQLVSLVARAQRSIAEVRAGSGEEERYSHSDLNGFAANLETTRKVVDLLRPLLAKPAAPLLAQIDSALGALDSQYRALRSAEGYASYDSVGADQRKRIADQAKVLADALDGIDPALGLSGL